LEKKIQHFPERIRQDNICPIVISDIKQRKEPFLTLFDKLKAIRDSSVHYGKGKRDIWLPPDEWIKNAEDAKETCMEAAKQFWNACYPKRGMPKYLNELNEQEYLAEAEQRIID
jgi:hypothetical protein